MGKRPWRWNAKKFLFIAACFFSTLSTIYIEKAANVGKAATTFISATAKHREVNAPQPTPEDPRQDRLSRVDASLDEAKPGQPRHTGGWAVRQLCSQPLDTLFIMYTAPGDWNRRAHQRATLFEEDVRAAFNWTGVFVVGKHEDPSVNLWVQLEAKVVGDVLIFPHNDTLFNLPYKFVGGMRWVVENCPNVRNVIKIDDDVGVQPFVLRRYLHEKLPQKNRSIHCSVWVSSRVRRNPKHRFYVPKKELAMDHYPTYCSGRTIISTMNTMVKLYRASKKAIAYAIDDAYVTGHLALLANVAHEDISRMAASVSYEDHTERMLKENVIFTHDSSAFATAAGRRAQWGLVLWGHVRQDLPVTRAFDFSYRLSDPLYRKDFAETRSILDLRASC